MKQQATVKMEGIDMVGVRRTNSPPEQKCYSFYYNQNEGIVSPGRMPQASMYACLHQTSYHYSFSLYHGDCAL